MLYGVGGKPYGDLSPYLDYNEFRSLFPEIMSGIAKAKHNSWLIDGAFFIYPEHPKSTFKKSHKRLVDAYEEFKHDASVTENSLAKVWHQEKNVKFESTNKLIRYLKAKYGAYDPMTSIHMTKTPWFYDAVAPDIDEYNMRARELFPKTIEWINNRLLGNIFESIGGMISIMCLEEDGIPNEHQDGWQNKNHVQSRTLRAPPEQFIHLRDTTRGMYLFDPETCDKTFINTWACVFNTNDWHSTYRSLYPNWSLRIDGRYTDKIKKELQWTI